MSLVVDKMDDLVLVLRLEGHAHLGKEFDGKLRTESGSRGCELRLLGTVHQHQLPLQRALALEQRLAVANLLLDVERARGAGHDELQVELVQRALGEV